MTLSSTDAGGSFPASLSDEIRALHERLREALRRGDPGRQLAADYTKTLIVPLRRHARDVLVRYGLEDELAVVAVGGLGRAVQFPHSDVDLVVLAGSGPLPEAEGLDAFMRELLHPLWDAKLQVNAVVRSAQEWLDQAVEDLTACTSLLDATHLAGDEALSRALVSEARARFFGDQRAHFLDRINDEVRIRHKRYGTTVYRVEPDLKLGPGGLRDLAVMQWALRATHGTEDLELLAERGLLGERVVQILGEAKDCLIRLRTALHLAAGRAQDRLVFRHQESMPQLLGMVDGGPGEVPDEVLVEAIESFMQDYYRAAGDVARHGVRVFARCLPPRVRAQVDLRIDERFHIQDSRLFHYGSSSPFEGRPLLALDAIRLAQDYGARIGARTADAIAEAMAGPDAEALVGDPEAQRRFLQILVDLRDAEGLSALETAFELGLIERLVPEFAASRGRMQHDSFHVYTVDQHTLYAVEFIKALSRGDYRKDYPLATALALGLDDLAPLCLATLLHDVGKPFGDQCEEGARIAHEACRRAGLDDEVRERVAMLVHEHLTMPLLSQKRDLSDPLLIREFAQTVGNRRALTELYLVSLADMATVSPDFLTSWKLTLLDELFLSTLAHLRRGEPPRPGHDRPDEPAGLPERYYALFDVEMRRRHLQLIQAFRSDNGLNGAGQGGGAPSARRSRGERPVHIDLAEGAGHVRLTLVTRDRPGLLSDAAAALHELGCDVVAADIFSVPGDPALVLDVFRIAADERLPLGPDFVARAESTLARFVTREKRPAPPRGRRRRRRGLRSGTAVHFREDPSGERSVVEVETEERSGVLARMTAAFAACGLDIEVARLTTEGHHVHDVFYVKKLYPEAQEGLRRRLLDALASDDD